MLQRKSKEFQTAGEAQRVRGSILREKMEGKEEKRKLCFPDNLDHVLKKKRLSTLGNYE